MKSTRSNSRSHGFLTILLSGLALLVTLLAPSTSASAATVYRTNVRGDALSAYAYTSDECGSTYESAYVSKTANSAPTVYYYSYSSNWCTNEYKDYCASGSPSSYDLGANLSGAHITAELTLYDCSNGDEVGTKSLDLTWTATTTPLRSTYQYKTTVAGQYSEMYRFTGQYVDATVSGSFNGYGTIATNVTGSRTVTIG